MSERALQILQDAFPQLVEKFFTVTIPLTLMSFSLALIIAVIVAMIQYAHIKGLSFLCRVYIWIVRCTPLLVQLYLVFYGLPSIGIVLDAYPTAVLVFGINEGAYMAESKGDILAKLCPRGAITEGNADNLGAVRCEI